MDKSPWPCTRLADSTEEICRKNFRKIWKTFRLVVFLGMKKYKPNPTEPATTFQDVAVSYEPEGIFSPQYLGSGTPVLKGSVLSKIELIHSGISKSQLEVLLEQTGLNLTQVASLMHLNERTLRNYTSQDRLSPEATERALELAELFQMGIEIFGSSSAFLQYLQSPIQALGNRKPWDFLDTSLGIQHLTDELGRIQHGVFA